MNAIRMAVLGLCGLGMIAQVWAEEPDPIAGKWRWNKLAVVKVFHADGTVTPDGKWRCIAPKQDPRKYTIVWEGGRYVDTVYLKKKASVIEGKNQRGEAVFAERITE